MQALTNKVKVMERKPMTFGERLYLPAILKGMAITFSHLFKKRPTINYPEQKRYFPPVWRGLQILNRDEEGRERCTACGLCAVACPAESDPSHTVISVPVAYRNTAGSPGQRAMA